LRFLPLPSSCILAAPQHTGTFTETGYNSRKSNTLQWNIGFAGSRALYDDILSFLHIR